MVSGATPDFRTKLAAQLAELIPEILADGKLDIEKLRELLAEDVADSSERFGLFWPGKKRALRAAQAPTTATLKPDIANSKDWNATQNVFIEGDNLEVLKILQRHYHNKVKLIYIDPPYNTGKDFVYPDNYKEGLDTYLEWTRQVKEDGQRVSTNSETAGCYHSNWLNMMYPRLKLARNLLTDDGVIFISIDDGEQAHLRKICDEIFGGRNFLATFIWINEGNIDNQSRFKVNHEYVVAYAKNESLVPPPPVIDPNIPQTSKLFKSTIENTIVKNGPVNPVSEINLPAGFPADFDDGTIEPKIDFWPKLSNSVHVAEGRTTNSVKASSGWSSKELAEKFINNNFQPIRDNKNQETTFYLSKTGAIYCKKMRDDSQSHVLSVLRSMGTVQGASSELDKLGIEFSYPKPTELLEYVFRLGTTANDIVLDFFAGSSSSAHAVMRLNAKDNGTRRFIVVQLPEPTPEDSAAREAGFKTIAELSRRRIELAGNKIKQDAELSARDLDAGFRAYKLVDTNFAKWRVSSDIAPNQLEQRLLDLRDSADDLAQAEDLLTEILLKAGFSLTARITDVEVAGLTAKRVDDQLLAYLDEHRKPTLEQLRALVDTAPRRLVVLEDTFHGDDELKTNLAQYAKAKGIELWTA